MLSQHCFATRSAKIQRSAEKLFASARCKQRLVKSVANSGDGRPKAEDKVDIDQHAVVPNSLVVVDWHTFGDSFIGCRIINTARTDQSARQSACSTCLTLYKKNQVEVK